MNFTFEHLKLEYQEEVICILNYYIKETTFAYREKIVENQHFLKFLDSEEIYCGFAIKTNQDEIVGYCLLEPYASYSTFSEVAEATYFIHPEYTNKGIGTLALKKLEDEAKKRGIKKLLVNISSKNIKCIKFHKKNGFIEYGRLEDIGKKFDKYFSVVWMGKEI
ncbi:GNAT family N-acetyltransferase [Anaerosolibacter sp.]|uniref:GNAT family N-acetyltransferase n=1 Tax=Anaerosolibacter sp. TaxID=1872527 RepID=UPI0039EFD965